MSLKDTEKEKGFQNKVKRKREKDKNKPVSINLNTAQSEFSETLPLIKKKRAREWPIFKGLENPDEAKRRKIESNKRKQSQRERKTFEATCYLQKPNFCPKTRGR